jgi:hypothetical protein
VLAASAADQLVESQAVPNPAAALTKKDRLSNGIYFPLIYDE